MNQMPLNEAIAIVVRDVHASYPHLSRSLAIKHALDTTSEAELNWDDPTAPAYQAIHAASTASLVLAVAKLGNIQLDRGDVLEIDGEATIDGMEPFEWMDAVFNI